MGQPVQSIMQIAYVVEDLEKAATNHARLTGNGPFFLLEHLEVVKPRYRGEATELDVSIALGYSGGLCVEFIQQHGETPSVYKELLDTRGGGFHHWGVMTWQFDEEVARYQKEGAEVAFEGAVAVGGRFAYMDTTAELGGMIELIELTPVVEALFGDLEAASVDWDGNNPVRRPE